MSRRESLARHSLIITKLKGHPATFKEIADFLAVKSETLRYDFNISKRTFIRDKDDILSLYNIAIQYDFSRRVYYIEDDDFSMAKMWMLEAFNILQAFKLSDLLSKNIQFENRKSGGTEYLHGILHAIENKKKVKFTYTKFSEEEGSKRIANPYALKEFKNRWYLLSVYPEHGKIRTYALDRMSDFEILRKKFELPEDFDVNEYYRHSFGVLREDNQQPEEVVLSFTPFQGKYIKSLPLHSSQKVLKDTEKEVRISLKINITHDFMMELMSHGAEVKIISPKSVADRIKRKYERALGQYA